MAADLSLNLFLAEEAEVEYFCPRRATAVHSVAVNRTPNLPIERRTFTTELLSPQGRGVIRGARGHNRPVAKILGVAEET